MSQELDRLEKKKTELEQIHQQALQQFKMAETNVQRIAGALGCLNEQIRELAAEMAPKNRAQRREVAKVAKKKKTRR